MWEREKVFWGRGGGPSHATGHTQTWDGPARGESEPDAVKGQTEKIKVSSSAAAQAPAATRRAKPLTPTAGDAMHRRQRPPTPCRAKVVDTLEEASRGR